MIYENIIILVYLLTAGLSAFISFSVWKIRRSSGVNIFSLLMLAICAWSLSVALGLKSPTPEVWNFIAVIRMVAVILTSVFWIVFALAYSNNKKILFHPITVSILFTSVVSIITIITNDQHGLFFIEMVYDYRNGLYFDGEWILGPYFWIHLIFSYSIIIAGAAALLSRAKEYSENFGKQSYLLIIGITAPLLGNIIHVFDLWRIDIRFDVIGFALAGVLISYAITRLNMFDINPIARSTLVDSMDDAMLVVDNSEKITDINPAGLKIFGKHFNQVVGQKISKLFSSQIEKLISIHSKQIVNVEWQIDTGAKAGRIFDLKISPIFEKGVKQGSLFFLRDITEQRKLAKQLKEFAITDALTGIFNHRHFYELFEKEFGRALRKERDLSLVIFDIDFFKKINDSYGHLVGDQILTELASIVKSMLRTYDIFARYGGEEFMIILPETSSQEAGVLAERLRQKIETSIFDAQLNQLKITISLGVSSLQHDHLVTSEDLINNADRALYHSKNSGRNQVTVYGNIQTEWVN